MKIKVSKKELDYLSKVDIPENMVLVKVWIEEFEDPNSAINAMVLPDKLLKEVKQDRAKAINLAVVMKSKTHRVLDGDVLHTRVNNTTAFNLLNMNGVEYYIFHDHECFIDRNITVTHVD